MSRSLRRDQRQQLPSWARQSQKSHNAATHFRCLQCKAFIGPLPWGGHHRNHCPLCLHSRHVDGRIPGDRASTCGGKMAPIGLFSRPNGEQVLVHRCLACDFERHNRIAADDNPVPVLRLPLVRPRLTGGIETGAHETGERETGQAETA